MIARLSMRPPFLLLFGLAATALLPGCAGGAAASGASLGHVGGSPMVEEIAAPTFDLRPEPEEPAAPATARPAAPPGACRRMAWSAECAPGAEEELVDDAAIEAFYVSRGVKPPAPTAAEVGSVGCFQRRLGSQAEDVLFCFFTRTESLGKLNGMTPFRRLDRLVGRTVRGQRIVTLLDAPALVEIADKEDPSTGPLFQLALAVTPEGKPFLQEPSQGSCERARAHNAEERANAGSEPTARAWALFDAALLERLCRTAKPARAGAKQK